MIQKKVCLVGMFATGKTSLVKQFIHSRFTDKYHSTVGVKIDRKTVDLDGTPVTMLLWDLAGKDEFDNVRASYLKGSAGIFFVVDGTRRETCDELDALHALVSETLGTLPPFVVALNKADLDEEWQLTAADESALTSRDWHVLRTSARTGEGVEDAFHRLARAMISP